MPDRIRVFISSKEREFAAQRASLRDKLNETAMFEVTLVEDSPPTRDVARTYYLNEVRCSHVYVALFGCLFSDPTREEYETAMTNPAREILLYEKACPEARDEQLSEFLVLLKRTHMLRPIQDEFERVVGRHLHDTIIRIIRKAVDSAEPPQTLGAGPKERAWRRTREGMIALGYVFDEPQKHDATLTFYRSAAERLARLYPQ